MTQNLYQKPHIQRYDIVISKSNNDIGQTNLIQMHIAMKPDAAPIVACPYPLALKHHEFLKQEVKTYLMLGSSVRACLHGKVP